MTGRLACRRRIGDGPGLAVPLPLLRLASVPGGPLQTVVRAVTIMCCQVCTRGHHRSFLLTENCKMVRKRMIFLLQTAA